VSEVDPAPITGVVGNDVDERYLAHYVPKDDIAEAIVNGWPVVALCGKIWIPSRDPEKHPVCPLCKELFAQLQ
jgi:hypothetical protein